MLIKVSIANHNIYKCMNEPIKPREVAFSQILGLELRWHLKKDGVTEMSWMQCLAAGQFWFAIECSDSVTEKTTHKRVPGQMPKTLVGQFDLEGDESYVSWNSLINHPQQTLIYELISNRHIEPISPQQRWAWVNHKQLSYSIGTCPCFCFIFTITCLLK